MKVALVYDRINKWGGAERVLLVLHELFPDAPLFTSVYNPKTAPWAKVFPKVMTSFLQKTPLAKSNHEFFAPVMPVAFENFSFDEYDLVISVTSEAAKGIITKPSTLHISYCLTPTRYLWSGYNDYFRDSAFQILANPAIRYLKFWDKIAAQRPDVMVAISKEVQGRIKRYYNRDSEIIYPPVELDLFNPKGRFQTAKSECFYLVVSRLVPYKRVDLAIHAFNKLHLPLVIIGTGIEEGMLKSQAKSNIKFLGQLTDEDLAVYYRRCTALVMPQEEDFGLVSLEAQASGTPVIAYRKGGAKDTIINGETGVFFDKQNEKSLIKALREFEKLQFNPKKLLKNAKRFSKESFKKGFQRIINENLR